MYAEFLKGLADIAEQLNKAATMGGETEGNIPTPYIYGNIEVRLDGESVGYFELVDEYVIYHDKPLEKNDAKA